MKLFFLLLGFLSAGLGAIGVLLPILPTTPFLLLATFCFAKSSKRFHTWFTHTSLYKKHLESFVEHRAMTRKTKVGIMASVTITMGIGFAMMGAVPMGRAVLVIVWIFHIIYFGFRVKTVEASV